MAGKKKHGLCHTAEYRAWQTMRLRCHNPSNAAYPRYGGRGIAVCDRWRNDFLAFLQDMGRKPSPKHELDRRENDLGYYPTNCRWVTRSVNDRNRRNNLWVEFRGQQRLLIELCEQAGIRCDTVKWRLRAGMSLEAALSGPARPKRANGVAAAERLSKVVVMPRITPERQQLVASLYSSGLTYDQIAEKTGVSYNSVGRIVKRLGAVRA